MDSLDILWLSEALHFKTGYGTVSRELCERWDAMGHNVNAVGWYVTGDSYPYCKEVNGKYEMTGVKQLAGEMSIGCGKRIDNKTSIFEKILEKTNPDVVSSLVDIWYSPHIISVTNKLDVPFCNYFPLDGEPFPPEWLQAMMKSDQVIAMSKWGKAKMDEQLEWQYGIKKDIPVIPHGVNTKNFYPLEQAEIDALKKELGWDKKFIVGFVGKNMSRKCIPRLMKAFKFFHDQHPDSILVMNVGNPLMSDYGGNLSYLTKLLGIEKDVVTVGDILTHNNGITIEKLRELYNLFDVHCSATSGEGFGLTTIESQACGTPSIICDYTTASELTNDGENGWLVPPVTYVEGQFGVLRAMVDIPSMTKALCDAYDNPDKVAKFGKAGAKFVKKNYNWDDIAVDYVNFLKKTADNFIPEPKRYKEFPKFRKKFLTPPKVRKRANNKARK